MNELITQTQSGLPLDTIVTLICIVAVAAIIVLLFFKLIKAAIGVGITLILIPMLFNLFFGDGKELVKKAADYLPPETGKQLEENYDYFKQKEAEDPVLNVEKIQETAEDIKNSITEKLPETVKPYDICS